MQKVYISTPQNVTIEYALAGVGDRTIANIIDYLIILGYALILMLFYRIFDVVPTILTNSLTSLPLLFYGLVSEITMNGQTLGMKQRGIKVITLDGREVGIASYLLRWLFRVVDILLSFGGIAILFIIFTDKGQRLGDIAAGTTVVKIKHQASLDQTIFSEASDNYTPVFQSVVNLSDKDIYIVKETLWAYEKTKNRASVEILSRKLKTVLDIKTDMKPVKFLDTLIKDYNHLTGSM